MIERFEMREIPEQYKPLLDEVIINIANEVRKIDFIIEELGERLEFNVDKHQVIIKRRKDNETGKI